MTTLLFGLIPTRRNYNLDLSPAARVADEVRACRDRGQSFPVLAGLNFTCPRIRKNPIERDGLASIGRTMNFHGGATVGVSRDRINFVAGHEPPATETEAPVIE